MRAQVPAMALLLALASSFPAQAAGVMFEVTDQDGRAVSDAVVTLKPIAGPAEAGTAQQIAIDQRAETFIPLVSVLARGGSAIFSNGDRVRHHVYSFSPVKQFQFILNPGETSQPVKFDKIGVVAIGCNIHDRMVTYVYVTDTKWSALTHSDGSGIITAVPAGDYVATLWHPRLKAGAPEPTQTISVTAEPVMVPATISLIAAQPASHHGGSY